MLKGNAIIGQSGGPTSVINSSLAGVIDSVKGIDRIAGIYGMMYGIEGLMKDELIDLSAQPASTVRGLRSTPSSALGSSRHKLTDEDLPVILDKLARYNIRYLFLIGGNDTMDTVHRVESYAREKRYELSAIGIPKTVDNDLYGTDHTPGFPSAARSNILNVLQAGILARDMQRVDKYVIYQTIGRDAGWLAAATAMARTAEGDPPHLIYAPEFVFDSQRFLEDTDRCIRQYGFASIVCGEGLRYPDGTPVSSSSTTDKFSNIEFGAMAGASAGIALHRMIHEEFGYRGEFQVTESLIMSDFTRASALDLEEAYLCGAEAVLLATSGQTGHMVTIIRDSSDPYVIRFGSSPLSEVAINARPMPARYFNREGNDVSPEFIEYMKPLTGELPSFSRLEMIKVK